MYRLFERRCSMTYGKDGKDGNLLAESLDARSASIKKK